MGSDEVATAGDPWQPAGGARFRRPALPALRRERLDILTSRLWSRRLGMVVAPAGSGKTTLLGQVAAASGMPVAWYRCEGSDGQVAALLDCLGRACSAAFAGVPGSWDGAGGAIRALEAGCHERSLLVVDDLHNIAGSPADAALEQLVRSLPEQLVVLMASRIQPAWNLSRARAADELLEIRGEDLRFRSWEVERLFREHYHQPLPPVELACLARSTEGWAAGLQLFHLATRDRMPEERRRVVSNLSGRSRLVSDYLARNVLDELPPELRGFLIETAVLARLSGRICDRFLDRTGSGAVL
jgi:ATP/maltotriose-dependent transcriptional regulator MalT